MRTARRWRPEVEALEDRTLLSGTAGLSLTAVRAAALVRPVHHAAHPRLALRGQVTGTWATRPTLPDTGTEQQLSGGGTVRPLGSVRAAGTLRTPGFVATGHTTGTLTLANAGGRVTLQLTGPPQPGFSQPPPTFHYTIAGGTGRYAGASGGGTAAFQEQPERRPVCQPGTPCPQFIVAARFTLTFPAAG